MRVHAFKSRTDRAVHAVIALHSRRVRRGRSFTVCAARIDDMIRLVPHSDPSREPAITCDVCLAATVAIVDIFDRPVRELPYRKPKGVK